MHAAGRLDDEAIELAFSKKKIEERKAWLAGYEPGTYLDQSVDEISYSDFVNKACARLLLSASAFTWCVQAVPYAQLGHATLPQDLLMHCCGLVYFVFWTGAGMPADWTSADLQHREGGLISPPEMPCRNSSCSPGLTWSAPSPPWWTA